MAKTIFNAIDPRMAARIQALRLMDDDFMTVVFSGNAALTGLLLRILLSRDDLRVKSVMTQREKRNLFGRSVRLDIVAEDEAGRVYNVEVQRADRGAAARRVRYNLAMLDSHTLRRGEDFSRLPETYIIFITEDDYFGLGRAVYEVEKKVKGTDVPFDDGCTILYVNGAYRGDDAIGWLMHDFCERSADNMHYAAIADRVRFHKQEEGGRAMCRIFEEYGDERVAERNTELVEDLLRDGTMPLERIAAVARVPLERVRQIARELAAPEMA